MPTSAERQQDAETLLTIEHVSLKPGEKQGESATLGLMFGAWRHEVEVYMLAPAGKRFIGKDQRDPLRDALARHGELSPTQTAGRLFAMACVSLEVTQRCNLDCTLCYLSDRAEMAKDVPMPILLDRIDMIASHYGPGTSVQISGGDPTLRKVEDLEALCIHIRQHGMRSCLMTNGIRAKRDMLERLAQAGLDDVAFHVDLTQERDGYPTEMSLNAVRHEYAARAKGLGLRVLFNTTVYESNIGELSALASFFRDSAEYIDFISFQMQADTGRGVLRAREAVVTRERVIQHVSAGLGLTLDFNAVSVGHSSCNRYTSVLVAGGEAVSTLSNTALIEDGIKALTDSNLREGGYLDHTRQFASLAFKDPGLALRVVREGLVWLWQLRRGIWRSGGRVRKMGILIHDFMDAENLDRTRCESCVFMVATEDGPLSMCVHNAERDKHIFTPAQIDTDTGPLWWDAETGVLRAAPSEKSSASAAPIPYKRLKGRMRVEAAAQKRAGGFQ